MKIILKDCIVECSYDEGILLLRKLFLTKEYKVIKKKTGRKTKLTKPQIDLIKKIVIEYPKRTSTSIAKDVNDYFKTDNVTKSSVEWWRKQ